ncbi:hypothetical protein M5W75_15800 [Paenibacillus larvae]|uniref:Uncharacterized protein n=2 Tax=Paenibacillus larvae TaxID=1464 RepID=A0A2L1U481_9BACL|nr:hypothetical protein [Paenibacillus larvae]AQZ46071.1 hypothetical protein B5S25_05035 [Paenibacillus larvae subsp. pulvifaciens]AVF27720.1 hypothetical protein ERICIII_03610 [Paenibacillus larvae subsp. larvae]MBH0344120.1 hypothetical protein [Paenibacillus larvae]MCY9751263.1 hypothetical protein [Paenibacillus larvae]
MNQGGNKAMNITKMVNNFIGSEVSKTESSEEQKQLMCKLLLEELKNASAEELLPFFRGLDYGKWERQIVVTLSFPADTSWSNFLDVSEKELS